MKALILAGGEGRRIKPVLGEMPKCLAPVQGRPFVERQIEYLREQGVTQFVLCVGIGASLIEKTLGDGGRLGVKIEYSLEETPAGTGGAIKQAAAHVGQRFLCVNGDTLVGFSLEAMESDHENAKAIASIVCRQVDDSTGKGTLVVGPGGEIVSFQEKPAGGVPALVNCGYYMMEKDVLEHVPARRVVSLEKEVFPGLLSSRLRLVAFVTGGAFVDIGTPEDYLRIKDKGWKQ
jgi:NDP-sugar pyrophosphorylase family protein